MAPKRDEHSVMRKLVCAVLTDTLPPKPTMDLQIKAPWGVGGGGGAFGAEEG